MNPSADPVQLMQEHGIRPTAGRVLVLRTLLAEGRPLSMTEIETVLESVDKSTVSRALAAFRDRFAKEGRGWLPDLLVFIDDFVASGALIAMLMEGVAMS